MQVLDVQGHLLRNRQFISPIDLGPTGKAWNETMYTCHGPGLYQVVLIEERRPGADEAHVSAQDAPELGQFVQAALAKKGADRCQMACRV